jgi:hypothetical protein
LCWNFSNYSKIKIWSILTDRFDCQWFWHKFLFSYLSKFRKNIYYLCQNFNHYYKIKFWSISTVQPPSWSEGWCGDLDTLRLFHKDNKIMFIILYKYYVLKISELKNNCQS